MSKSILKEGRKFQALQCEGFITIILNEDCDDEHVEEFNQYLKKNIEYSNQDILIDCAKLKSISLEWIKPLLFLQIQLSLFQKKVRFVSVGQDLIEHFKSIGADKAFKYEL